MIFLIYTILVILQQYKGMTTEIPDPCPSDINNSTIVDMCKPQFAKEDDTHSGNFKLDSVVLRIMIQDNCFCRVKIYNQIEPLSIGLRKFDGLPSSTPVENECGLVVDINHIPDMSTGNVIAPIECDVNATVRNIPLLLNSTLQFKSRIINGTFTRGYCMQIQRDSNTNSSQVLRIDCDAPTTQQTTRQIIQSDPTTDTSGNVEYPASTSPHITDSEKSSTPTTTGITTPKTDTSTKVDNLAMTTNSTIGIEQTTYIVIGAGSGVALILLVVLVVVCLRKSTHKAGTNGNVSQSYQQEESDDELQDNVLYVPATEFDITGGRLSMEGNYSTVDVDTPRFSNTRLSMEGNYNTVDDDAGKYSNERLSVEGNYSTVDVDTPRFSNTRLSVEGNYSTVDDDARKYSNERLIMEGNYSTVDEDTANSSKKRLSMDGNYSTVELDEHLDTNCGYPENSELGQTKGKQTPTIKPKPKSSCINSEEHRSSDQNINHITPTNGSDNVYAIVDKSSNNVPTINISKGEGTCQPDQTYAVVDKARKRKSSSDETNKKKFEINSGNRV